jgi:histidinol-phosphate phosphatase family protein
MHEAKVPVVGESGEVTKRGCPKCRAATNGTGSGEVQLNASLVSRSGSMAGARGSCSRPGILLDRDGTIIVDRGYVGSVDRVEFIEGSAEAIAKFNQADIPVAVVTNQAGVARGFYGIDDVARVHQYIARHLAEHGAHIDLFLYCPYHPAGVVEAFARASEDRKPRPGMAKAAEAALSLNLTASWVVGDRHEDIGLAEAVGASAVYLGTDGCQRPGVWSFPSLAAAAPFILERIVIMKPFHDLQTLTSAADGNIVKFPVAPHASAASYFDGYAEEIARAAKTIGPEGLDRAAAILVEAYACGARMFSCGNGGSAAIANHMQCDHVKNIRTNTDLAPRVLSLSTNVELLTAIANDMGYEDVFVYQLQSQSGPGDVLIAVSSSGRSPNIVRALTWAREHGLRTISITGFDGGAARTLAEVSIHVDCTNYGVVEDLHQAIMHALAQYIRQSRMTGDTISTSVF